MELFVVFVPLAIAVHNSTTADGTSTYRLASPADDHTSTHHPTPLADDFVGLLQESENGPIEYIGNAAAGIIPSCKLGPKIGNPICFAKCVARGHKGGYCRKKRCVCVG